MAANITFRKISSALSVSQELVLCVWPSRSSVISVSGCVRGDEATRRADGWRDRGEVRKGGGMQMGKGGRREGGGGWRDAEAG